MAVGTILVVEDEESIATLVRAYLEREGYHVECTRSGLDALERLDRTAPVAVVLDLGLPDIDGFEVCRRIRARSSVPILMVTARDEEPDRVAGLVIGADDYISKPFSPRELVARVGAVLRRLERSDDTAALTIADVLVRTAAREVRVAGESVELRGKEFDLLRFLVENRGRVVSRERLLDEVWGMSFAGGTRTVDVHVAQIRRKLGRPDLIQTIRGYGYKATAP
ncbi:MAG: response regulator transcription factor [Actinobacteria bacterium]|nr:response regulator transcription factor [Actinomycetota bacterium]